MKPAFNPIDRMRPPESWDTFSQHQAAHSDLRVLRYLSNEPVRVTIVRRDLGIPERTMAGIIKRLVESEVVERVGGRMIRLAII